MVEAGIVIVVFGLVAAALSWLLVRRTKTPWTVVHQSPGQDFAVDDNTASKVSFLQQLVRTPSRFAAAPDYRDVIRRGLDFIRSGPAKEKAPECLKLLEECLRHGCLPKDPDPIYDRIYQRELQNWSQARAQQIAS